MLILLPTAFLLAVSDPHVHGEGELSIVSDANELTATLVIDQHTLLGESGLSSARGTAIQELVAQGGQFFSVETTVRCGRVTGEIVEVEEETGLGEHHDNHNDHHDDHGDHEDHRDFSIIETYRCDGEPSVVSVTLHAFDVVEGLERVDVIVLTSRQQSERSVQASQRKAQF